MADAFDPYHKWLGVRDPDRPPNHYRLLGLEPFESDLEAIANAADRQMAHVRHFQAGRHGQVSQRILNELAEARLCLLNAARKQEYDDHLRRTVPSVADATNTGRNLAIVATLAIAAILVIGIVSITVDFAPNDTVANQAPPAFPPAADRDTAPTNDQSPPDTAPTDGGESEEQPQPVHNDDSSIAEAEPTPQIDEADHPAPPLTHPTKPDELGNAPLTDPEAPTDNPGTTSTPDDLPSDPPVDAATEAPPATLPYPTAEAIEVQLANWRGALPDSPIAQTAEEAPEAYVGRMIATADDALQKPDDDSEQSATRAAAILTHALDTAVSAQDLELVDRVIAHTATRFEIFEPEIWVDALEDLAANRPDQETSRSLARLAVSSANAALEMDQLDLAQRANRLALASTRTLPSSDQLAIDAQNQRDAIRQFRRHEPRLQAAKEILAENPDDPAAHLELGIYYSTLKDDWDSALEHLAASSDEELRLVALGDLRQQDEPGAELALGDAWWNLALSRRGTAKQAFQRRAAHWYALALPLDDDGRAREVERRLAHLAPTPGGDPTADELPDQLELPLDDQATLVLRRIPEGTFQRADPPSHVTISSAFYLGAVEVTQQQWIALLGENPSYYAVRADLALPVENVSWNDAARFLAALNRTEHGRKYRFRLPTGAEWEYASRAGADSDHFFGDDLDVATDYAWLHPDNAERVTHRVGTLKPNPFGLYDVYGNVWEWCADVFGPLPEGPQVDPAGPVTGRQRVLRGGSFLDRAASCSSVSRRAAAPDERDFRFGLRIACDPL